MKDSSADPAHVKAPTAVRSRLAPILDDLFGITELPEQGDLFRTDVPGWDSIGHFHLVLELEQEFGVALSDNSIIQLTSIHAIEKVLLESGVEVHSES